MELAPIGVSTYSRLIHLKQTIEALQKNTLAKESELYIFSDAPQKGDEEIVQKVRDYIHTVDGFKKVHIVERETNGRVANNRGGMKQLLDEYGKMIWFEDDNVTSEYFLEFINDCLNKFKDQKHIFGVGGFNVPLLFEDESRESYHLSQLFNGWGFATWNDRNIFEAMRNNNAYLELKDKDLANKIKNIHPTLHKGLKDIYEGNLDAGDYKIVFHLIKNDMYMIKPNISLVKNIGNDGSGVHCGVNDKFDIELENKKIIVDNNKIKYDIKYDKNFYNFYHPKRNIFRRIVNSLKINLSTNRVK